MYWFLQQDWLWAAAGGQRSAWITAVNAIAAASSSELKVLVKQLHQLSAQTKASKSSDGQAARQSLQFAVKTVLDMPGAAVKEPNSDSSLCSIWDDFSSAVNYTTSTPALKLHALLAKCAESITGWKQRVLATRDGSGCLLSSQEVPEFKDGLPVRITVNGCFEADCLDSNDLVKLFCCCPKDNALLQQGSDISIAR